MTRPARPESASGSRGRRGSEGWGPGSGDRAAGRSRTGRGSRRRTGARAAARARAGSSPSSGGIGSRLKTPRTTFTADQDVEKSQAERDIEGGFDSGIDESDRDHGGEGEHEVGGRSGQGSPARPRAGGCAGSPGCRAPAGPSRCRRGARAMDPSGSRWEYRVEGEAAPGPGGVVALEGRDRGVAELVEGDADHHRDQEGQERLRFVGAGTAGSPCVSLVRTGKSAPGHAVRPPP